MHSIVIHQLPSKEDMTYIRRLQQRIAEKILELHQEVDFEEIHDSLIFKTKEDKEKFDRLADEMKLNEDMFNLHSYSQRRK